MTTNLFKLLKVVTKLSIYILLVLLANPLFASTYGQKLKNTKVNINVSKGSVLDVFKSIENQSSYSFFYNNEVKVTEGRVSLDIRQVSVYDLLCILSKEHLLKFKRTNRSISVSKLPKNIKEVKLPIVIEITGMVMDSEGTPLPGASIMEKGTTNGTTADFDGNFIINTSTENPVLVVSYMGFLTQEFPIKSQNEVSIILQEDSAQLDEVVVIGYGSQKRSDLTGSISSLSSNEFQKQPVTKPSEILQGRVPGVSVSTPSGRPGGNQVIRIRGANSIIGDNSPLIVVDGLIGADFNSLNPNNIESIQVLKDASSTAIYGSRGANGVILVTTKRGRKGKAQITFDHFVRSQEVPKKVMVLSPVDYMISANNRRKYAKYSQQRNDLFDYNYPTDQEILMPDADGNRSMTWLYYHPQAIDDAGNGLIGIDWQDEIFRTGITDNYNLSISGGNEKISYNISGSYLDQEGLIINSDYERFNLRASMNAQASDHLSVGATIFLSHENDNPVGEGDSGVVSAALYALPVGLGVKYPDNTTGSSYTFNESLVGRYFNHRGSYGGFGDSSPNGGSLINPVAAALEPEREIITNSNTLSAYLEYELFDDLKLKVTGGSITSNGNNRSYFNELINGGSTYDGERTGNITTQESSFWQNSNILTYKKDFDKHSLAFTGLFEQQYTTSTESFIAVQGFNNNATGFNAIQTAEIVSDKSSYKEKRVILSYMGRINYSYDNRFLATVSLRSDGSSVFGANNKWGTFPSTALAWRISNEKFLEDNTFIDKLKLRSSYGITGNQAIDPYQTLSHITTGGTGLNYPTNGSSLSLGSAFNTVANPNLKWEKTAQTNVGVDVSLLNYRLNFTADYYYKMTSDLLSLRTLASQSGFSSVLQNVGEVENRGLELLVEGALIENEDFRWDAGFNITFNKNTVLELSSPEEESIPLNDVMYLIKGQPLGAIYGYQYVGVWQLGEEEEAFGYGQIPGTAKVIDQNNDGIYDENDKVYLGSANPDYTWGFNTSATYEGFDLDIQFQGSQGGEIYNQGARNRFDMEDVGATGYRGRERWHPTNQLDGYYQRVDYTGTINQTEARQSATNIFTRKDAWLSDIFVEDASYVRLSNVTLGYNFAKNVTSKIGLDRLKLYFSGQNLKLWTDYTGYDPELATNENDGLRGFELNSYPRARTYTLGLKVEF
ncbi:SusC/RagA family TonB-linked outer membrane protein [Zobellia alginiliquefaciens]|uniref:SusC/RagA family TonB-linked outer membrane protein n=1 Tax=Zobellia alginiliquefaciens TaxID=3032586 RepID=UPI0023E3E0B5|nr:TonB-dependent receptor [Zobellia alginiliquefaciens]